jgi:excisionase family DNA binding protein
MPNLDDLLAALADVPTAELPKAIAALEGAKAAAWARLTTPPAPAEPRGSGDDVLLDVEEAARRIGKSTSWLYRAVRARRIPFARKIGHGLRFDPAGLARWVNRQPTAGRP